MKLACPRKRSVEGGSPHNLTGGHMNRLHMSQDKDVEGQGEDEELSRREVRGIEGKREWEWLGTNASPLHHSYPGL